MPIYHHIYNVRLRQRFRKTGPYFVQDYQVRCTVCGRFTWIREITFSQWKGMCRACLGSYAKYFREPRKKNGVIKFCEICGTQYYACKSQKSARRYCSKRCSDVGKQRYENEIRVCEQCGMIFTWRQKPFSNCTGQFCSRKCKYDNRKREKSREDRNGWHVIRNQFIKGHTFCWCCGRSRKKLYVHHIEPYRIALWNEPENLVVVCAKCHKHLEKFSDRISVWDERTRRLAVIEIKHWVVNRWFRFSIVKDMLDANATQGYSYSIGEIAARAAKSSYS